MRSDEGCKKTLQHPLESHSRSHHHPDWTCYTLAIMTTMQIGRVLYTRDMTTMQIGRVLYTHDMTTMQIGRVSYTCDMTTMQFGRVLYTHDMTTMQIGRVLYTRDMTTIQFGHILFTRDMTTMQIGRVLYTRDMTTMQIGRVLYTHDMTTMQIGRVLYTRDMTTMQIGRDGQPENIGYGYQKSITTKAGPFSSKMHHIDDAFPSKTVLQRILQDYVEDGGISDSKRSNLRERGKKSSFRERLNNEENEDERKMKKLSNFIVRKLEEQERGKEFSPYTDDGDYLELLESIWDRYRKKNPQIVNIDDLPEGDVEQIMSYLADSGSLDRPDEEYMASEKVKPPGLNSETLETLMEEDDMALPDERDEDIIRLSGAETNHRIDPEQWLPVEEIENPDDEVDQRLSLEEPSPIKRVRINHDIHDLLPPRPPQMFIPYSAKRKRYPVTKRSPNYYTSPPLLYHKGFDVVDNIKDWHKEKNTNNPNTTDLKVAKELNQIFSSINNNVKHANENGTTKDSVEHNTLNPSKLSDISNKNISGAFKNNETTNENNYDETTSQKTYAQNQSQKKEKPTYSQISSVSEKDTPIEIKKKSIDWSDYFGIDRRRKKTGSMINNESEIRKNKNSIDDDWLLNQYYRTLIKTNNPNQKRTLNTPRIHEHPINKKQEMFAQPFDTRIFDADTYVKNTHRYTPSKKIGSGQEINNEGARIDNMNNKLKNIEDLIINEAVKYTGAHEGSTDSEEIQAVKDKVMSRLAAAYSLEKMRRALGEFKSSLQAQKNSIYNPNNRAKSTTEESIGGNDEKNKRIAVKKEKALDGFDGNEDTRDEDKNKKRTGFNQISEKSGSEFLEDPVELQMENNLSGKDTDDECLALQRVINKCRTVTRLAGDSQQIFLPLCVLHQICYACPCSSTYNERYEDRNTGSGTETDAGEVSAGGI
uniref:Uncharacterized protein n=1 Tax=Timema bartmani TaxID=61472 RepID=A0A7R9ELQ2_9NEOP|nr:unnamed protein product [Timema bartmani]